MRFPEKAIFKLIDKETKKPVPNIAILIILYAHKKNNYSVGAKISDSNGEIILTKNDCLREIESSKNFYLMDYTSSLEECLPHISIKITTTQNLNLYIKKCRENRDIYQKYWDCSEEYLKALDSTNNDAYISKIYDFSESELWQNNILVIELEQKK